MKMRVLAARALATDPTSCDGEPFAALTEITAFRTQHDRLRCGEWPQDRHLRHHSVVAVGLLSSAWW